MFKYNRNIDIHVHIFCKTFLTSITLDNDIHIDEYSMEKNDRSHKNGGGLVFFMKENIPYKSLTCFECQDRETLFIEICNCNVSP